MLLLVLKIILVLLGFWCIPYFYMSYRIERKHNFCLTRRVGWKYVDPGYDEWRVLETKNEKLIADYRKLVILGKVGQVLTMLLLLTIFMGIITGTHT